VTTDDAVRAVACKALWRLAAKKGKEAERWIEQRETDLVSAIWKKVKFLTESEGEDE
jgi:hypothetical protein